MFGFSLFVFVRVMVNRKKHACLFKGLSVISCNGLFVCGPNVGNTSRTRPNPTPTQNYVQSYVYVLTYGMSCVTDDNYGICHEP